MRSSGRQTTHRPRNPVAETRSLPEGWAIDLEATPEDPGDQGDRLPRDRVVPGALQAGLQWLHETFTVDLHRHDLGLGTGARAHPPHRQLAAGGPGGATEQHEESRDGSALVEEGWMHLRSPG